MIREWSCGLEKGILAVIDRKLIVQLTSGLT